VKVATKYGALEKLRSLVERTNSSSCITQRLFHKCPYYDLHPPKRHAEGAFQGESVAALSLSNFHAMSTRWNKLFVRNDYLLGFSCPRIWQLKNAAAASENIGAVLTAKRSWRKFRAASFQTPTAATYHPMVSLSIQSREKSIHALSLRLLEGRRRIVASGRDVDLRGQPWEWCEASATAEEECCSGVCNEWVPTALL
jgi:hypothetical protein